MLEVLLGHQVPQVRAEQRAHQAQLDHRVRPVQAVPRVPRVLQAQAELRAHRAPQVLVAQLDRAEPLVLQGLPAHQVPQVRVGQLDRAEPRVLQVLPAPRVLLARRVQREQVEPPVRRVRKAQPS